MKNLEKNKIFKLFCQMYFYGFILFSIYMVICGNYLFPLLIPLSWLVFVIPYWFIFKKRDFSHAFQDFVNLVDDPFDNFKEWLHCMNLPFGYQLNISFIMKNRKVTWDIIRKKGYYENCDPEDYPEEK